ncbi:MAG: ATP-binding protein [Cyanobacteria bacterium J06627_28]
MNSPLESFEPAQPFETVGNTTPSRALARRRRRFGKLTVRLKITLGYIIAVGIPAIGALTGLAIGNQHQSQALQTLTTAYQEQHQLNNLQTTILQNRLAKELGPFVEDPIAFEQAVDQFLVRLDEIQRLSTELEVAKTRSVISFRPQLRSYQQTLSNFSQAIASLLENTSSGQAASDRREQELLALAKGEEFAEFIQFSEYVTVTMAAIDQEILAAQDGLRQAERFRMQIILGSLVIAVVAANLLALLTGLAIARPLEKLTDIALQVTRDANTQVSAAIVSNDEIGTLADALNRLIQWVNTYTKDLKQAQLRLIQSEKMSSMGQLVAGIAHEINNPVNFIHANIKPINRYTQDLLDIIQAYQTHYPHPPGPLQEMVDDADVEFLQEDLPKLLDSMRVGSTRIREIVLSLRNFSRLDEAARKAVDLHEGIDNTLLVLKHRLEQSSECTAIELVKSYGELPLVTCYPGQLNQAVMNILGNAIDALEMAAKQSALTDEKNRLQRSHPYKIWITTERVGDDRIRIAIADNGIGMSEEVRSLIFDPFFTTKPIGSGTGLGLSISYQIITELHQGSLECESSLQKGTTFLITIPAQ